MHTLVSRAAEEVQVSFDRSVEVLAAIVAIVAALFGVLEFEKRRRGRRRRRTLLEQYLKGEKGMGYDQGQRTIPHLMAQLGMTEQEILEAAFASKLLRRRTSVDDTGKAQNLLFEYDDTDELNRSAGSRKRSRF